MSEQQKDLISVTVDGREIAVPRGTNMIEAAAMLGVEVPHYCYHPKLTVVGNCRMCLVELGMPMKDRATGELIKDENGEPKIGWMPRPAIACATTAAPGMQIRTNTSLVQDCRNGVMEFLLINHPLDCPICDQAGECRLQEFATDYGRGYSRFVEKKVVKPKRTVLGPRVMLDDERCILCSRCIRFCQEVPGDDVLGFVERGSFSTLTCHPGKKLENNYSLNTVDICPVGALTSTDFRFKMRPWFLKETPSICTESSVGANTVVHSREGRIYRITPRRNDEVNDTWMADSGRIFYKEVEDANRLREYTVTGEASVLQGAASKTAARLREGKVAIVGSGLSSVEEQFLLRKIAEAAKAVSSDLVARIEEGDELLISSDRRPNTRGALVTGLIAELPKTSLEDLGGRIDSGEIKTVLVVHDDLLEAGLTKEQLGKVTVIFLGTNSNATSDLAEIVVPTLSVFEKDGSFINQQFRLQKFVSAVPGPDGVRNDFIALSAILAELTGETPAGDLDAVWETLAGEVAELAGLRLASLPSTGTVIDHSRWAGLPFPEGKSLHYEPSETAVAGG